MTRHAALTADAADAIVPQKEEAGLRRLELYSPPLIFRDAAAWPPLSDETFKKEII